MVLLVFVLAVRGRARGSPDDRVVRDMVVK